MLRFLIILLITAIALTSIGCQAIENGTGPGGGVAGLERSMTPGILAAQITEIDGQRVSGRARSFYLPPGRHAIRAVPRDAEWRNVSRAIRAFSEANFDIRALDLFVERGERFEIGVVVRRHRTLAGYDRANTYPLEDWQTTIIPVVVRRW